MEATGLLLCAGFGWVRGQSICRLAVDGRWRKVGHRLKPAGLTFSDFNTFASVRGGPANRILLRQSLNRDGPVNELSGDAVDGEY